MAEFRAYKARTAKLVADGHLTMGEANILNAIKMQGISLGGGSDQAIRMPKCRTCGREQPIIGRMAQTFDCCGESQSIADALRAQANKQP